MTSFRWLLLPPALVTARALRVRLSVGPRARFWREVANRPGELRLVALGDSLTQGIGSSRPAASWLARFVDRLQSAEGRTVRVDNRAVYGARIADLLAGQLPLPDDVDLVVLCIGANDAGRTEPAAFRRDLRTVCAQLPAGSIVGDVPEFRWGPRVPAAAELARVVREVVAEHPHLRLAEVERHTTGVKILTGLAGDFFHPNDASYDLIAEAFVEAAARVRV